VKRERGVTLIVVLIVIGVLLVANVALVRSMGTANRVAGNKAFKQAATQAAEVALNAGEQFVSALTAVDTSQSNRYFATMQPMDAAELPTTVNWANVAAAQVGNYQVKWIVERMCSVTPVIDSVTQCLSVQQSQQSSKRAGSPSYQGQNAIYYRITAQVVGPRSTESYIQSAVSR
jgi:type IV pilus assembly protein PilX